MSYRVLYLFQSASLSLFEIKQLGLPATAPPDQVYQWLHYLPGADQLTRLDFVAMESSPPFETREFRQGTLRFSDIEGTFHPVGTTQALAMRRDYLPELPPPLAKLLAAL